MALMFIFADINLLLQNKLNIYTLLFPVMHATYPSPSHPPSDHPNNTEKEYKLWNLSLYNFSILL